jgi:hypothetical protein
MKLTNLLVSLAAIAPAILAGPINVANTDKLHATRAVEVGEKLFLAATSYLLLQTRGQGFDNSRIKDYPDKKLLSLIDKYFIAFTAGDFDGMAAMQADEYDMTDIRKNSPLFSLV